MNEIDELPGLSLLEEEDKLRHERYLAYVESVKHYNTVYLGRTQPIDIASYREWVAFNNVFCKTR